MNAILSPSSDCYSDPDSDQDLYEYHPGIKETPARTSCLTFCLARVRSAIYWPRSRKLRVRGSEFTITWLRNTPSRWASLGMPPGARHEHVRWDLNSPLKEKELNSCDS
jgi:hypothetical protein